MLHYTTYHHPSSSEWVTFVHGAGGSSSIWFRQIRAFREQYNVLLIDLRGHGRSKILKPKWLKRYTFEYLSRDILEVLDHLQIQRSHFIGISLGTILIRELAEKHPERVSSMILGGAVMKLNLGSSLLMRVGILLKSVVPYLFLYKLFAFIIMPKKRHKKSRNLFVREAKKLAQKEFIRWFKLAAEVKPLLRLFREKETSIPTLYIMGAEDHMFLPSIRKLIPKHQSADLHVVENSGHVVNVDQPAVFNQVSLAFIGAQS